MNVTQAAVLVLVSVGISVTLTLWIQPQASPPEPVRTSVADPRLAELGRRIEQLENAPPIAPVTTVERVPAEPADGTLAARIDALEGRLAALEGRIRAVAAGPPVPGRPGPEPAVSAIAAARLVAAQRTICDPQATVADRLAAHEALRHVADAYTPQMVQELVHIGSTNGDAKVRADVWRFFDGSTHLPEIVPALLRAVTMDGDPAPREEASETLGNYPDDPAVRPALEHAAQNDPAERVRQKAARTLQGLRGRLAGR